LSHRSRPLFCFCSLVNASESNLKNQALLKVDFERLCHRSRPLSFFVLSLVNARESNHKNQALLKVALLKVKEWI
jgi:hypothetical protein